MNNELDQTGPWVKPTGDLLTVIVTGRPEGCCLACTERSARWNNAAMLASVYCEHRVCGWSLIIFAATRTPVGEWLPWAGSSAGFTDEMDERGVEAAATIKRMRAAGVPFTLYRFDQPANS